MTGPFLRHVTVEVRLGSRQHFYHFFFGVLLPLVRHLVESRDDSTPLLLEECGPMNAILDELDLPGLIRLRKAEHRRLARVMPATMADRVDLVPLDLDRTMQAYDADAIRAGAEGLLARWRDRLEARRRALLAEWSGEPRILIIDRGPPDAFYASEDSERKTAGAERRRVGNHDEMVRTVSRRYPGCRNVFLEGRPLAEQIVLFQLADVVVAQHGAALSNIVWMRHDARIIELEGGASPIGHFVRLAGVLGLSHIFFPQEGPFGAVDADGLIGAIAAAVAGDRPDRFPVIGAELPGIAPISARLGSDAR